jgi:uncharacterized membrane protein YeaQ/YmgE (transglycosylase-associated protein family)
VRQTCHLCLFLRVVLLGAAGAIGAAWLAPRLGFDERQLIMPAVIGALAALGLAALLFRPRR